MPALRGTRPRRTPLRLGASPPARATLRVARRFPPTPSATMVRALAALAASPGWPCPPRHACKRRAHDTLSLAQPPASPGISDSGAQEPRADMDEARAARSQNGAVDAVPCCSPRPTHALESGRRFLSTHCVCALCPAPPCASRVCAASGKRLCLRVRGQHRG